MTDYAISAITLFGIAGIWTAAALIRAGRRHNRLRRENFRRHILTIANRREEG